MTTWTGNAAFHGSGGIDAAANLRLRAIATFPGSSTFVLILTKFGVANFAGSGNFTIQYPRAKLVTSARLSGSGHLSAHAAIPNLRASAALVGSSQLMVVSPGGIGNDITGMGTNSGASLLSTALSVRASYPTVPNPSDPFMRRPSKTYKNYAISVRFTGSGRLTAIAS